MKEKFIIDFDQLPPSVNNYLKPATRLVNGRPVSYMYETREAKDFKKRFTAYLKREVKRANWSKEITKDGHWYLDVVFIQSRTNEDNNNYFKILCDSLKEGGVIDDDKNLLARPQMVMYDSKNPRFKAILHKVDYVGIFNNQESYDQFESECKQCSRFGRNCSILRKAKEGRIQEEISKDNGVYYCSKRKVR